MPINYLLSNVNGQQIGQLPWYKRYSEQLRFIARRGHWSIKYHQHLALNNVNINHSGTSKTINYFKIHAGRGWPV